MKNRPVRGAKCIYNNCGKDFRFQGNSELPPGWNSMMLIQNSPQALGGILSNDGLDVVLCPEHAGEILGQISARDPFCAYGGCINSVAHIDADTAVAQGWWRVLVGRDLLPPAGALMADVNGFLCPRHVGAVNEQFYFAP